MEPAGTTKRREYEIAGQILQSRRSSPLASRPPATSSRSWGRGPLIRPSAKPGIAGWKQSRVTARRTVSPTGRAPLARSTAKEAAGESGQARPGAARAVKGGDPRDRARLWHRRVSRGPRPLAIEAPRSRWSTPCGGQALCALDKRSRGAGLAGRSGDATGTQIPAPRRRLADRCYGPAGRAFLAFMRPHSGLIGHMSKLVSNAQAATKTPSAASWNSRRIRDMPLTIKTATAPTSATS